MNITHFGLRNLIAIIIMAGGILPGTGQAMPEAGTTELASLADDGMQGNQASNHSDISADGRYIAFDSFANNLVSGDYYGTKDVFVRDRSSGTTTRVSVASDGTEANNYSEYPSISADGRYVAFASEASNLVSGDTNGYRDIFVHDLVTGETTRVSVSSTESEGNEFSYGATLSADGRYVAFSSEASNLVEEDSNNHSDIFVHDLDTGETTRVSVSSDGLQGNYYSWGSDISADGNIVVFSSGATNLVPDDSNGFTQDVFVHDRTSGETTIVSLASNGTQGNDVSENPSISSDGSIVAFDSVADNLAEGDTNLNRDVFVHDRTTGETTRTSVRSDGGEANNRSSLPRISADGNTVTFESSSWNLVDGDTNLYIDIFVRDRLNGITTKVSVANDGTQGNNHSYYSAISADGRYVTFDSPATNLVWGDANNADDIFLHDRGEALVFYSISGQVVDTQSDPISGVRVSTASGEFAISGSNGNYMITSLNSGSYIITPHKGDFVFSPSSHVVNLPPTATGIDFEAHWHPGQTERVSISSDGTQAEDISGNSSISADGNLVAFASADSGLVGAPSNGEDDIFVRDRSSATTVRVSVSSEGTPGDFMSANPSISADGRYVAFDSEAGNLVEDDLNWSGDIFVHDLDTGETTLVSLASDGTQGNDSSTNPAISADGRYVAFESYATNFQEGDTHEYRDVFWHDRDTGVTTMVSVASDGTPGDRQAIDPAISGDGRYVAFWSDSTNLVSYTTNAGYDVFVHDMVTGETTCVSMGMYGEPGNYASSKPSISADGNIVAFTSGASNLVPGDTNEYPDVFAHNRETGTTTRISVSSDGSEGDLGSTNASISGDGRFVAFVSDATNLVSGDTNGVGDIFVHDRQTGQTIRVSVASDGMQGNAGSDLPSFNANGSYIAFDSDASNLVVEDTNNQTDVFFRSKVYEWEEFLVRLPMVMK